MAQRIKHLPAMRETWVRSLGWEDPLEKKMATHSSILGGRAVVPTQNYRWGSKMAERGSGQPRQVTLPSLRVWVRTGSGTTSQSRT